MRGIGDKEACCRCFAETRSGIYIRAFFDGHWRTAAICDPCWVRENPGREPIRVRGESVRIVIEVNAEQAAGLLRFAEKIRNDVADDVLYPHVAPGIREMQRYAILEGFQELYRVLLDAGVRTWPWLETGEGK